MVVRNLCLCVDFISELPLKFLQHAVEIPVEKLLNIPRVALMLNL